MLRLITTRAFLYKRKIAQIQARSREIYLFMLAGTDFEKMFLEI